MCMLTAGSFHSLRFLMRWIVCVLSTVFSGPPGTQSSVPRCSISMRVAPARQSMPTTCWFSGRLQSSLRKLSTSSFPSSIVIQPSWPLCVCRGVIAPTGPLARKNISDPNVPFTTFMTPDFHYVYVSRLQDGLTGYATMFNAWMALPDKVGKDKGQDLMTGSPGTTLAYNEGG